ncbi:male sterility protein-domain-containing protein [Sporodiniella umbellata]|nr:male sterility protein-domain-containing protein [Sporodiniella umbellata]
MSETARTSPSIAVTQDEETVSDFALDPTSPSTTNTSLHEDDFRGPIVDFYRQKNILITGATGFIGKAILWKLIQSLKGDIGYVYILIRSGGKHNKTARPAERLKNEILDSKAFVLLRQRIGEALFDKIAREKLIPVSGDIISPDISISLKDRECIVKNTNIVLHCAAALNYNERLDLALETNTLGTLRMMDLADECKHMETFAYSSLVYTDPNLPSGHIQERVYPMRVGDPEDLFEEIINLELKDIPKMTQRVLSQYPNTYTFTKALTEHLIMKRVDINRIEEAQGGKAQWPISIIRATQVGPAAFEPLPGWADGVTGVNGLFYLMSKGIQTVPSDKSSLTANIVPVDYFARVVLGSAATAVQPGYKFILPYNEVLTDDDHDSIHLPNVQYFPYIYQLSSPTISWRQIYEAVRSYWSTHKQLPTVDAYFGRFFKMFQKLTSTTDRMTELAQRGHETLLPFLKSTWIFDSLNVESIQTMKDSEFGLEKFRAINWHRYTVNAAFGTHLFLYSTSPAGLRRTTANEGWLCALHSTPENKHQIIDQPIESIIFGSVDIEKRTERMTNELNLFLENPRKQPTSKNAEQWLVDLDAMLDDWCHDDSERLKTTANMGHLGAWLRQTDREENIRVNVLNDIPVGNCIKQITKDSGVPQTTVVNEALKILQRMQERTQLHYIWSAGALLHSLFDRLFTNLLVSEADICRLKAESKGKKVVYVPVCKTVMDSILLWYVCLRYKLPLPAIVCDEALAALGPISDILRITGAYFIRRDHTSRSPLSTAVTAAYTKTLLSEHGTISMSIERARSRTGRLQNVYHDGLVHMVMNERDTIFLPVQITYEKVPELRCLVDQVLDQRPKSVHVASTSFLRPSVALADREAAKDKTSGKYGRVFVSFGQTIDAKSCVNEASLPENKRQSDIPVKDEDVVADYVAKKIQKGQYEATIVSPVALAAAVILSGRITSGITVKKIQEQMNWLHLELLEKSICVDWQSKEEDAETVVHYSLQLLDARSNLIIDGRRICDESIIRVVEHADNVMDLSYMASPLIELFLPEALFATAYLSHGTRSREQLLDQFTFLVRLFKHEFVYPWSREEKFGTLLNWFLKKELFVIDQEGRYAKKECNESGFVGLLASFIYPTLDAYWITSCSLSALRDLPYMPRKIVPVLAQWIAAHLITGRRTIYREVLSTEASQNAVENFLLIGFIDAVHSKTKLSPEAQLLLIELGVATNEDLVTVSATQKQNSNLLGLSDIASLCHEIEKYRLVSGNLSQNAQVFDKCQNQIRSILRAEQSYASKRGMKLSKEEDQMVQLVYSLKAATATDEGRRISQAYNLNINNK